MYLTEIEYIDVPSEIAEFEPISCMACHFSGEIKQRWFKTDAETEKELLKLFKEQYGDIERYAVVPYDNVLYCSTSKCPRCNSSEIFEDLC